MIKFLIMIIILSPVLYAQEISELDWLTGEWFYYGETDSSYEVWHTHQEGYLQGYGLTIINGDTAFYEDLKIFERNDTIYYQAVIEDQNEGKPVLFRYINRDPDFIFLNRDHDFPQKIIYTPVDDTLYIKLEGIEENYEKRVDFYYIRR